MDHSFVTKLNNNLFFNHLPSNFIREAQLKNKIPGSVCICSFTSSRN